MKMKTDMRPVRLQYFMVEKLSSLIFPVFPFPWQAASTNQTADLSNAESPGLAKVPSPSAKSRAAQACSRSNASASRSADVLLATTVFGSMSSLLAGPKAPPYTAFAISWIASIIFLWMLGQLLVSADRPIGGRSHSSFGVLMIFAAPITCVC